MNRSFACGAAALCVTLLCQSGCTVMSQHPFVEMDKVRLDKRILGHWRPAIQDVDKTFGLPQVTEAELGHIFVGRPATSRLYGAPKEAGMSHLVNWGPNHEVSSDAFVFFTAKIGTAHYLDLMPCGVPTEPVSWAAIAGQHHLFLKYEIDDDRLTLWPPNVEATIALVDAGKLKGKVTRGFARGVELLESAESWSRFLQTEEGAALFKDDGKIVVERAK